MKKIIVLLFFCILLCSTFITADIVNIGSSTGTELSVGGSRILTSFTGEPTAAVITLPETPSEGDGGTSTTQVYSFKLDKEFLSVKMLKGKHYQEEIIITNDGTEDLLINISLTNLQEFIFPEEENFVLKNGEIKTIKFDIYLSEKEDTDTYIGKINFNSAKVSKFVNVVLDIKDRAPLFDIKTTVLKKEVAPGNKVTAEVVILNLGDLQNIDVELESNIQDFEGNIYTSKKESFAIDESHKKKIFLEVPKDIQLGNYIFYTKVNYENIGASSYDTFKVVKIDKKVIFFQIIIILLILSLITGILIILIKIKQRAGKNISTTVTSPQASI